MPSSSVAVRSLALAAVCFGAVAATAKAQNVMAFNPYNGVGLPGGAAPPASAAQVRSYPLIDAMQPPPSTGMAFNPWRPGNAGVGAVAAGTPGIVAAESPGTASANSAALPPPAFVPGNRSGYSAGASLPPPPPGPIESRVVAIPERGDMPPTSRAAAARAVPVALPPPPSPPVAVGATEPQRPPAPAPAPVPVTRTEPTPPSAPPPAPPPTVTAPAPPPPASSSPPIVVSALPGVTAQPQQSAPPAAAPPARAVATAPPTQPPPPASAQAPAPVPVPMVTVSFAPQSAEINGSERSALDALAKSLTQRNVKQVELRGYSAASDQGDARKIALARVLSVRSYLIDQGVKARIEVGAFASPGRGGGGERVDIVAP